MNKPNVNGDIRVVGLVAGTHLIEDIGRDVAYGATVVIPAELALMSKDLWRGISQKHLYQLPTIPTSHPMTADPEKSRLERYVTELESHVVRLESENKALREQLQKSGQEMDSKLDSILMALKSGAPMVAGTSRGNVTAQKSEVADGTAPTFLPSEIRSKDMDAHIDIQGESTQSGVSEAAERLRKMRKG
jgi:hypothetical protein